MANDLIDEVVVSIVPILLGGGTRLFDGNDGVLRKLEPMVPVHTASASHLRYRVIKNGSPAAYELPSIFAGDAKAARAANGRCDRLYSTRGS